MKRITAFFLLGILIVSNSCQLPPSPNEPFYCKINGKKFRPGKDTSPIGGVGIAQLKAELDTPYNGFYITARKNPQLIILKLKLQSNNTIEVGQYQLDNTLTKTRATYYVDENTENSENLESQSGVLNISKVSNNAVWGTFEFKTKDKNGKEYVISNGQFNALRYK